MTRRFDRLAGGEKLHMQSLCALAHFDFNQAGAYAYEQSLLDFNSVDERYGNPHGFDPGPDLLKDCGGVYPAAGPERLQTVHLALTTSMAAIRR